MLSKGFRAILDSLNSSCAIFFNERWFLVPGSYLVSNRRELSCVNYGFDTKGGFAER